MRLYVGNLPCGTTDANLEALFSPIGAVTFARVLIDKDTGERRGLGYVEMGNQDGQRAIAELDGYEIGSLKLRVDEAYADRSGQRRRPFLSIRLP